jgi:hypothetical protein
MIVSPLYKQASKPEAKRVYCHKTLQQTAHFLHHFPHLIKLFPNGHCYGWLHTKHIDWVIPPPRKQEALREDLHVRYPQECAQIKCWRTKKNFTKVTHSLQLQDLWCPSLYKVLLQTLQDHSWDYWHPAMQDIEKVKIAIQRLSVTRIGFS